MVDPGLQFRAEEHPSEASKRSLGAHPGFSLRFTGLFLRKHMKVWTHRRLNQNSLLKADKGPASP